MDVNATNHTKPLSSNILEQIYCFLYLLPFAKWTEEKDQIDNGVIIDLSKSVCVHTKFKHCHERAI